MTSVPRRLCLAVLLGLSLLPAAFAATNNPAFSAQKLVVALKPDKNPDAMLEERKTVAEVLSPLLGKPVEVITPTSAAVIQEGLANGTVDVAFVSSTDMFQARKAGSAVLLLATERNGKPYYLSYWICLKDKPYTKVEDLKGKPVAFASRTSTSGYLVPLWDLHKRGLVSDKGDPEEFFGKGNCWYGSGYVSAAEHVLRGESEAAALSYYVLDEDKYLTAEQRGKLKKLTEQGPVPTHVLAASTKLSGSDRDALRTLLKSLNEPANQSLRDKVFGGKLTEVDEVKHLEPIVEAMKLIDGAAK